jgi:hypothetical protein
MCRGHDAAIHKSWSQMLTQLSFLQPKIAAQISSIHIHWHENLSRDVDTDMHGIGEQPAFYSPADVHAAVRLSVEEWHQQHMTNSLVVSPQSQKLGQCEQNS